MKICRNCNEENPKTYKTINGTRITYCCGCNVIAVKYNPKTGDYTEEVL